MGWGVLREGVVGGWGWVFGEAEVAVLFRVGG